LKYTGREELVVHTLHIEKQFRSYMSKKAQSLGIEYEGVGVDWQDNGEEHLTEDKYARDEYFEHAQTVFAPAVAAWETCIKTAAKGLKVTGTMQHDGKTLSIVVTPQVGAQSLIQGFV